MKPLLQVEKLIKEIESNLSDIISYVDDIKEQAYNDGYKEATEAAVAEITEARDESYAAGYSVGLGEGYANGFEDGNNVQ